MKVLITSAVLLIVLGVVGILFRDPIITTSKNILYASPCENPKRYSIGTIDSQFQISESTLKETVAESAHIWSKAYGKPLFVYDPQASFTINLIYDNRQSLNTEIGQLNEELKEKDTSLKPEIDEYNRKSDDLQNRISALNKEITAWNERGGAPEDVYDDLKSRQTTLHKEAEDLNAWADSLSISTKELNKTVDHLKDTVATYNDALNHKPEGGKYILDEAGERIEINIYDSRLELENILAHELGHSLGMDHVMGENAIMYSKTNSRLIPTGDDLAQLKNACRARNVIQMKFTNFSYYIHQTINKLLPQSIELST